MKRAAVYLNPREDKRLKAGHMWIYSNEINQKLTPIKNFTPGEWVDVHAASGDFLGVGYINPHSLIAVRLLSQARANDIEALLKQRINEAHQKRAAIYAEPFYRLIFAESDGIPGLIVDRFGDYLVMQCNTAGIEKITDTLVTILVDEFQPKGIFFRNESEVRIIEQLPQISEIAYGEFPEVIDVHENGLNFHVPVHSGQKTGWFYDHRENRKLFASLAQGKRVLDVFSYLGAWGLLASLKGALEVTCVDSSTLSQSLIQKNAEKNNLPMPQIIIEDAFEALKKLQEEKRSFDLIVVDPPAFIKRKKDHAQGARAYQRINELALSLLSPQGILFSASCSMHFSGEDLQDALRRACLKTNKSLRSVYSLSQGPDHPIHLSIPETHYLKGFVLQ